MHAAPRRRLWLCLFVAFFFVAPRAWGACGDGILDPGEQCDDGNTVSCDGCEENCTLPACGNGIVCPPEACDDGNTKNGDGCSSTCTLASKCTGMKIQAAGKLASCLLGLEAKEAATLKPKDEEKVVACRDKMAAAFAKADAKGSDCHGTNDQAEADVDTFVATVQADIGSPSGASSKCDAKKLKAVAKEAQCVLASKVKLSAKGTPEDPAKIDKCRAKLAATFASAGGDCSPGGPGGPALIDADIAMIADVLYVKFWPAPIPYPRSPYVENPASHLPAAFREGTGGYDGHFISGDHPTMYLQHAGNYGDKPGCPSCLVHDGDEGANLCTATGVCSTVPVSGAETLCCRQTDGSGNCIDNSPPPGCLQDPYGNVTQAGINEADVYYGKISQGLFGSLSQQYDGSPGSGPQNLQEWMHVFGFENTPAGDCTKPSPIESITDWALRCGCVSYFNKMELELGRFLCCTTFPDLNDDASFAGNGVACMVGNFGKDFNQVKGGLEGSLGFKDNQNTVCFTTRPSRPAHFRTEWWAFNGVTLTQNKFGVWTYGPPASAGCPDCPGPRLNDVLLDRARHRPIPLSCANCHGGVYAPNDTCVPEPSTHGGTLHGVRGDADCGQVPGSCVDDDDTAQPCSSSSTGCHCKDAHMIADSKFLPLNPWTLIFPGDPGAYISGLPAAQTRAGQMMRVHDINQLAATWPIDGATYPGNYTGGPGSDMLTGVQLDWLQKLYPSGPTPASDTAPSGWTGSDTQRDLWNEVVLPACANCHMTIGGQPVGTCGTSCGANNDTPFAIDTYDHFVAFDAHGAVCKQEFHMPHAAPTQEWFWSKHPYITIRGPGSATSTYLTPREAFFGAILQQETKCCGPAFYGSSTKHCSLTNTSSVDPFAPVNTACDCPLDVPLHPDQVELPDPLPPFAPLLPKKGYDGDGCAVTEVFTKPGGGLASRLNFEPSDDYCGLPKDILQTTGTTIPNTRGTDGQICDNSLVSQGICVPGCRLADPRTGVVNLTTPFRACPKAFECRVDNKCHVCGSIGEALCTTGQLGVGPCPISGSPIGTKCM